MVGKIHYGGGQDKHFVEQSIKHRLDTYCQNQPSTMQFRYSIHLHTPELDKTSYKFIKNVFESVDFNYHELFIHTKV